MPPKKKTETQAEAATTEKTFEEQLLRLETLVTLMEQGGLSLEDMMRHYEEGMALQQGLQKQLEEAKGRLTELVSKNGQLVEVPLEEMP